MCDDVSWRLAGGCEWRKDYFRLLESAASGLAVGLYHRVFGGILSILTKWQPSTLHVNVIPTPQTKPPNLQTCKPASRTPPRIADLPSLQCLVSRASVRRRSGGCEVTGDR